MVGLLCSESIHHSKKGTHFPELHNKAERGKKSFCRVKRNCNLARSEVGFRMGEGEHGGVRVDFMGCLFGIGLRLMGAFN